MNLGLEALLILAKGAAMLLHGLRQQGYRGKVALSTSSHHEARQFEGEGGDLVFAPYADAAREAADRLFPPPEPSPKTNQGVAL